MHTRPCANHPPVCAKCRETTSGHLDLGALREGSGSRLDDACAAAATATTGILQRFINFDTDDNIYISLALGLELSYSVRGGRMKHAQCARSWAAGGVDILRPILSQEKITPLLEHPAVQAVVLGGGDDVASGVKLFAEFGDSSERGATGLHCSNALPMEDGAEEDPGGIARLFAGMFPFRGALTVYNPQTTRSVQRDSR